MNNYLTYLQGMSEGAVVIRLAIATLFGSLIGWERVVKHHSAGIKTFSLVSLGSAAATVLNIYLAMMPNLNADVSRIPAGVVSGIGFLGAGTILVTGRNQIKGLSTAASLWVTSCMGMVIGGGYLIIGVSCFLLVLLANIVLLRFSTVVENNSKYMCIYAEVSKNKGVTSLTKEITELGFAINSMTKCREKTLQNTDVAVIIDIDLDRRRSHQEILNTIGDLSYVYYVEEV
ncbi:MgtC/SapB family protein [Pseudobutyrivibrio sp. YE44]|uniref:MgtC/SapB family protein n=1 Tax=Pseudobutyrivibrio sp. YE44 TaxID=1520802 RepID=UPI000B879F1E|nr:MgtC/SapB family protein [Pseudobutyrivibrio sp. YE44]